MITVVSGTNRPGNRTLVFANHFAELLRSAGQEVQVLDLAKVNLADLADSLYDGERFSEEFRKLQDRYFLTVDRFAFFVPEYNGSYPGVLKLLIDAISVRRTDDNFGGKYAALIGIASGRAGNLRGMDHLGAALAHMGAWVLPGKTPISSIHQLLNGDEVTDEKTTATLRGLATDLASAGSVS